MQGMIQTDDASNRCVQLIRNRCEVVIQELQDNQLQITGVIGSWHGKQLASEAARSLFPDRRIRNPIKVVKTH